ncbi:MAG: hypothetical protein JXQ27_03250 [Acidobacteria bacterium]|nr:hypothetical protein [Acidobacteriota bacterium]
MRRWMTGWLLCGFWMGVFLGSAAGQVDEAAWSVTATLNASSHYVWRGLRLSRGLVFQPEVCVAHGDWSATLWGNVDAREERWNETDILLTRAFEWERLTMEIGYIYYHMLDADDTHEVSAGLWLDMPLAPGVQFYYDFAAGDGGYVEASVNPVLVLGEGVELELRGALGFNLHNRVMAEFEDGSSYAGVYSGDVLAAAHLSLTDHCTLVPYLGYSLALGDKAVAVFRDYSQEGRLQTPYGGIRLEWAF